MELLSDLLIWSNWAESKLSCSLVRSSQSKTWKEAQDHAQAFFTPPLSETLLPSSSVRDLSLSLSWQAWLWLNDEHTSIIHIDSSACFAQHTGEAGMWNSPNHLTLGLGSMILQYIPCDGKFVSSGYQDLFLLVRLYVEMWKIYRKTCPPPPPPKKKDHKEELVIKGCN